VEMRLADEPAETASSSSEMIDAGCSTWVSLMLFFGPLAGDHGSASLTPAL